MNEPYEDIVDAFTVHMRSSALPDERIREMVNVGSEYLAKMPKTSGTAAEVACGYDDITIADILAYQATEH